MFRYYSPSHCLGSKMDELKILYGDFNLDTLRPCRICFQLFILVASYGLIVLALQFVIGYIRPACKFVKLEG